jgi:hypothetical protein
MANDFYTQAEEDQGEQYALMEQEFHEWQVYNDVVALIATNGLQSVLNTVLNMMEERGIK